MLRDDSEICNLETYDPATGDLTYSRDVMDAKTLWSASPPVQHKNTVWIMAWQVYSCDVVKFDLITEEVTVTQLS